MSSVEIFLSGMSAFFSALLPVAGVFVLVYLALLIREFVQTAKSLTKTLDTVNDDLKMLEGPLNTADEISQTVDEVHAAAREMAMKTAAAVTRETDNIRTWFESRSHNDDKAADDAADVKTPVEASDKASDDKAAEINDLSKKAEGEEK